MMNECLADETVQGFVQGTIPASDLAAVEQHLRDCPACLRVVADTVAFFFEERAPGDARGSTEDLPTSVTISRYLVGEVVGAGGVGIVYAAFDPQLKRKVALKLIWPTRPVSTTGDHARLLREAQAMARLSHPNVVNVYDAGTFNGKIFIVMELVEGPTLQAWLSSGPRPWWQILDAFAAVGRGLAAAHAAQLVHRDFKPENVLLGADGRFRVTDFGLAADRSSLPDGGSGLVGTPAYMAPEQFSGQSIDARTDQFSFCVALHKALYGQRQVKGVPSWVAAILARGLQAQPDNRYDSMNDLLEAIDERLAGDAIRKRLVRFALAAAALALASVATWQWISRGRDTVRNSTMVIPVCGNGIIETGEQCDDKNQSNNDACLTTCKFAACGDGHVRTGIEDCDDGNQRDGDGCDSSCLRCATGDQRLVLRENGGCYTRHDRPASWEAAAATCRSDGAHLVTFSSMAERRAVYENLIGRYSDWYWIGLHDPLRTGTYTWITGEPMKSLADWAPSTSQPKGSCVGIQNPIHKMAAMSCDSEWGFICERDTWVIGSGNNHAYRAFQLENTWEAARNLCQRAGTHLLTIADAQEAAFIHAHFPGTQWVGAVKTSAASGFQWITGEQFSRSLFSGDDPDLDVLPDCVVLADDLGLHDRFCDKADYGLTGLYGVICESE